MQISLQWIHLSYLKTIACIFLNWRPDLRSIYTQCIKCMHINFEIVLQSNHIFSKNRKYHSNLSIGCNNTQYKCTHLFYLVFKILNNSVTHALLIFSIMFKTFIFHVFCGNVLPFARKLKTCNNVFTKWWWDKTRPQLTQ